MNETRLLKTENGFRVVAVDLPGRYSAMVEMFVEIGSKYETAKEAGMSHFMEHMAFKGTTKRPKASQLNKELDSMGVSYNAGTSYESTSYYIKCLPSQLGWAGEFLSDVLLNSTFAQDELEKERGVVLEEIAMYNDTPSAGLSSDFYEKFVSSEVGCWNIIGNKSSLNAIDSKLIQEFRGKYFDPKRCLCVIVTDFKKTEDLNSIMENIAKDWEELKTSSNPLPVLLPKVNKFDDTTRKDVDQAHLCLGWQGVVRNSPSRYVSRLVEMLLCGNFSSRLVSLLREELGVAYYVHSIGESMGEIGIMGVQAGVKMDRVDEILLRTKDEVANLSSWITPEALKRSKDYLRGITQLSMDKSSFWSEFIGQKMLLDDEMADLELELDKHSKVEYEEVLEFCRMRLKPELMSSLVLKR